MTSVHMVEDDSAGGAGGGPLTVTLVVATVFGLCFGDD